MTAGTETCGEAAQPSPLNVEDVKFFFLEELMAVELLLLMRLSLVEVYVEEEERREEMVNLEQVVFGSVSEAVKEWLLVLGFLFLMCSAIVDLPATTADMVVPPCRDGNTATCELCMSKQTSTVGVLTE